MQEERVSASIVRWCDSRILTAQHHAYVLKINVVIKVLK